MEKECKKILLLKGLQPLNDEQFSMVKSLLDSDLNLSTKMKEDYTKVKIADMMQKKFRGITCVDKLLELLKDIEGLEDTVKTIKNERRKVMKKYKAPGLAPMNKRKQEVSSNNKSPSTANKASESADDTLVSKKKKTQSMNNDKSKTTQPTQEWVQPPESSVTGALSTESFPQPLQMPPPTPGSSSMTKKRKTQPVTTGKPEMMQPIQGWAQLGQPSVTGPVSPGSFPQPPQMAPSTPSSSSTTKVEENYLQNKKTTIKTENFEMRQSMQEWDQPGQPSVAGTLSPGSFPQPHQMLPSTPSSSSATKKPRLKAVPTKASREEGLQTGPKEVMVVKATEPFVYDVTGEEREMFHATVVTESQFFQVKVFHVSLREKFIPKRVIAISDYIGRNGFLEVYNASCVTDVNPDRKMEVSKKLIQNANATPKIKDLHLEKAGTFVSGVYQVHKKRVLNECITLYEIQDNTGMMDVLMYGRLTKVNCKEGDKLTLICFEISGAEVPRQLRSVTHSFIKVIKPRKNNREQFNTDLYM